MLEATHAGRRGTARFERTVSSKLKQMIAQGFLLNPEVSPPGLVADMSAALRSCNSDCKSLYMTIMDAIDRHVK